MSTNPEDRALPPVPANPNPDIQSRPSTSRSRSPPRDTDGPRRTSESSSNAHDSSTHSNSQTPRPRPSRTPTQTRSSPLHDNVAGVGAGTNNNNYNPNFVPPLGPPPRAQSPSASRRRMSRGVSFPFPDPILSRPISGHGLTMTMPPPAAGLDWIVPNANQNAMSAADKERYRPKTVGERLQPTIAVAHRERDKAERTASRTGTTLNVAIGAQVLLGALTTAVSAATTGRQTSIATSVLGGMSTLIASYLARMRGSSEPDSSIRLTKDLDQFIRDIESFVLDHGHETGFPPQSYSYSPYVTQANSPTPTPAPGTAGYGGWLGMGGAGDPNAAGNAGGANRDSMATASGSANTGGGNGTAKTGEKTEEDDATLAAKEKKGKWDERIDAFRRRLEELLGGAGSPGGGMLDRVRGAV